MGNPLHPMSAHEKDFLKGLYSHAPALGKDAFNCPVCHAYAHQYWYSLQACIVSSGPEIVDGVVKPQLSGISHVGLLNDFQVSHCARCNKHAIWHKDQLIFPGLSLAPLPSYDMPEEVKTDYLEAREIAAKSPRAAAALLRLALQKLMPSVGGKGDKLNDDIGQLVKQGLPEKLQQALDVVRVIGNNAVHPGSIDLRDDSATAIALFGLINFIVDYMITQPKRILDLYSSLPEGSLAQIAKRDQ